jgi:CRP-like cAMP-binding protein
MERFLIYLKDVIGLDQNAIQHLQQFAHPKSVKKGTILLKEGQQNNDTYFVCSGILRSYTVDEQGKEHVIQFASENWFITANASFQVEPCSLVCIDCIENAECVVLDKSFFEEAIRFEAFNEWNIKALNNRVHQLHKRINLLMAATAQTRYLDFLDHYINIYQRVPQWMVASYLGVTPESLSRVRKELSIKSRN